MSEKIEKNFSGFVKAVIGATGLLAMGAVVAGGAMVKGFNEGVKAMYNTSKDQDETDLSRENKETEETKDKEEN